jgi:hypothetical protein
LLTFTFVPQNAIDIELCLRLTNGKPALALLMDGWRVVYIYGV